jgi:HlyD family secretion protein
MAITLLASFAGCNQPKDQDSVVTSGSNNPNSLLNRGTRIAAQGQLMPAGGIIRLMGPPGDRIADVKTEVGAEVTTGQVLLICASHEARHLEIEVAQQKLMEAEQAVAAQLAENQLALQGAEQEVALAKVKLESAREQLALVHKSRGPVALANQGVERTERLVRDPATATAIPKSSLEQQKIQKEQLEAKQQEAELSADHNIKLAELQLAAAEKKQLAITDNRQWITKAAPLESLKKQLALLNYQLTLTEIRSPIAGQILRLEAPKGSSIGTYPLVELADNSKMICNTEISEVDVQRLKVGQKAQLSSPAITKSLQGTVIRIDPIVGTPQYRSPNPLAPVDYRVVNAVIEIDQGSTTLAGQYIQLQVDVTIDTTAAK